MRLLCAADLHLGRVPSRLPNDLRIPPAELGPAAAWKALVATCVDERPDALLLAGDLIDDERDLFGAYGDLESGLKELEAAGIPVVAVAGNHDVHTLPRLAGALSNLTLLGRGGRWEAKELGSGPSGLRIVGWSFPSTHVDASPLDAPGHELLQRSGATTIGLLHADLDAGSSRYAPVTRSGLAATGVDAWLLGHVHVPSPLSADAPIGYLGSLTAVDPGERERRGAWRLTSEGGTLSFDHLPLAPLRYLTVDADVAGASVDDVATRILTQLRDTVFAGDAARATAVHVRVHGSVADPQGVLRQLDDLAETGVTLEDDGRVAFVHAIERSVRAEHDLERLADLDDPVGVAARTILQLRDPDAPERTALLARARERLAPIGRKSAFQGVSLPLDDDAALAARLERVATEVLDALSASRDRSDA